MKAREPDLGEMHPGGMDPQTSAEYPFEIPQSAINAATRQRTIDAVYRCLDMLAAQIGRDHERCGKAACRRAGRCRGFACVPDVTPPAWR